MRRIRIAAVSMVVAAGLMAGVAAPASAATPRVKGCVGESLSALATNQPSNGSFGAGAAGLAQDPSGRPGLGDFAQTAQAGLIPDDVLPNTCND
jgi:hypothetical protein